MSPPSKALQHGIFPFPSGFVTTRIEDRAPPSYRASERIGLWMEPGQGDSRDRGHRDHVRGVSAHSGLSGWPGTMVEARLGGSNAGRALRGGEVVVAGRIRRHWKGLLASAVIAVVVLVVGVPYVYIHFIEGEPPAPLSLNDVAASSTTDGSGPAAGVASNLEPSDAVGTTGDASAGRPSASAAADPSTTASSTTGPTKDGLAGTWTVGSGSQAGYRVHETLAGQSTTAVGRTDSVSGSLTIEGTRITAAQITVQVADIASDNGQRDRQFVGRIMDAAQYPTATFTLAEPIAFESIPQVGDSVKATASGRLTLHGTTKAVTFPITVKRTSSGLAATGTIDIAYQDYGIDNPSVGGFVSVGDSGTIEFLLVATHD